MKKIPNVLTIAGSDSGGGAGIQADLKTFTAHHVYGMSVITALTAQNTLGVQGIYPVEPSFIKQQMTSVFDDISIDAIKIGMLASSDIINVLATALKLHLNIPIVLDPVIVATSGDKLLADDAYTTLIEKLFPLAFVITPNRKETEILAKMSINTVDDMKKAAGKLHKLGPKYVVVKGGDLHNIKEAIDVLFDGNTFMLFSHKKINTKNTHGTGCTFSSAIAANLAKREDIYQAVKKAKQYISHAIETSDILRVGHGHGPVNHCITHN